MTKREIIALPAYRLIKKNIRAAKDAPAFFFMPQIKGSLKIFPGVFNPAITNVSPFFAEYMKPKIRGEEILEIGAGSGFISILFAQKGARVTAVDISKTAVLCAKENAKALGVSIRVLRGDLFNAIGKRKFDTIVFNPPLVPVAARKKKTAVEISLSRAIFDPGMKLLEKFFKNSGVHLKMGGRILLIYTNLAEKAGITGTMQSLEEICVKYGFKYRKLGFKTFHEETYTVYEIKR